MESLIYLCKFAFFTGILTKSQIGELLGADRAELKGLVRSWYDDHRRKGLRHLLTYLNLFSASTRALALGGSSTLPSNISATVTGRP